MIHLHVKPTLFQLCKHLVESLLFGLIPPGRVDPPDVVILLVSRTFAVAAHQRSVFESIEDKLGDGMDCARQVTFRAVSHERSLSSNTASIVTNPPEAASPEQAGSS